MWLVPESLDPQEIISFALWPILDKWDDKPCLRNIETTTPYCIFKQLWTKQFTYGTDLIWFWECLEEIKMYDYSVLLSSAETFDRAVRKFQATAKIGTHGVTPLLRIWRKINLLDMVHFTVCSSLAPGMILCWESAKRLDQPRSVSIEVHADSKSASDRQSNSDTPSDFVGVRVCP